MKLRTLALVVVLGLGLGACGKSGAGSAPRLEAEESANRGPEAPVAGVSPATRTEPGAEGGDDDGEPRAAEAELRLALDKAKEEASEAAEEERLEGKMAAVAQPGPSGSVDAGLGWKGDGQGAGGEGYGRIRGLGKIDTGGGSVPRDPEEPEPVDEPVAARAPAPENGWRGGLVEGEDADGQPEAPAQPVVAGKKDAAKERPKIDMKKIGLNDLRSSDELGGSEALRQLLEADATRFANKIAVAEADRDRRRESRLLADEHTKPERFLPRMFYFENTYLGGNARYLERMRRLERSLTGEAPLHRLAHADAQGFDAPGEAGLALTAALSHRWVDQPGRVILQVGIQGSERYGWRRPPVDLVLVVDEAARAAHPGVLTEALEALLRRLGPSDRLGVVLAGAEPVVLGSLERPRSARAALTARLLEVEAKGGARGVGDLGAALGEAGALLRRAHEETAVIPGTQAVVLLTAGSEGPRVRAAQAAVHALTLQGAVSSVVQLGDAGAQGAWWSVADAGHGNYHVAAVGALAAPLEAELENLSKVVARLLRLNVRLGKNVKAIRVLGTRKLDDEEVKEVKAREVAVDQNLSKTLGVTADRGDDDDGVQTVIPYFYGGDDHVVLLELWVEGPGAVADVTLQYKDMVALGNATARASVSLAAAPRPETLEQAMVRRNLASFLVAEALADAGRACREGLTEAARETLAEATQLANARDRQMLQAFRQVLEAPGEHATGDLRGVVSEALALAAVRKLGEPAPK